MKRVSRVTVVVGRMAAEIDLNAIIPELPINWFARGPRGGVYLAVGPRHFEYTQEYDFSRNLGAVRQWAESSRYIRPGTRLHAEALEQLA